MRYRPGIDGVRALAVVAVVAYHAGVPGFTGGFIGVDVFFVISGFLITGLLAREVERSGRLALADFYGRRARRLLPVAALVTVVTVGVGWWVLSPLDRSDLSLDALATSTYTINLRLAAQHLDYLRSELPPSAFQQFWSLAVEEQFYLVWPLLLWVTLRGRARRHRAAVAVGIVVALSFATCLWWVRSAPEWAFFALPARAWQLGLGALLALGWARVERFDEEWRRLGRGIGLLLIAVSVLAAGHLGSWPGPWALVPTVATVLVLAGPDRAVRWLECRPLTWVGERSYSWYLWHWPAMVFVASALDRAIGGTPAVVAAVGTLGLAHLTYVAVEQPVRGAAPLVASARASVALGLALTVVLALTFAGLHLRVPGVQGDGVAVADPPPLVAIDGDRLDAAAAATVVPANLVPPLDEARDDVPVVFRDGCNGDLGTTPVDAERIERCTYGDPAGARTIVLVGDSHAAQWVPALVSQAEEAGTRLVVLTKSACPIVDLTVANQLLDRAYAECDAWRRDVAAALDGLDPDLVIATSTSHYEATAPGGGEATTTDWITGLTRTLAAYAAGAPTVLLGDTPYPAGDVPACLAEHLADATACTLARGRVPFDYARVEAEAAAAAGATLVPTVDLACGAQSCPVVVGRHLVYRDASHLTTPYVELVAPQLAALVTDGAARAGAAPGLLGVG